MSECCCPPATASRLHGDVCAACGSVGTPVDEQTVKALLTADALRRFTQSAYRFCPDPHCAVVYFDNAQRHFSTSDVRVPVWQKEPAGERMVCYCFDENERGIAREIRDTGTSKAVERVREHIAARRCACDIRNPRGACCLGDVIAAVERIRQS